MFFLLALQLFLADAGLFYSLSQHGDATDVLITYPTPGVPIRACLILHDYRSGQEVTRECWTPKNTTSESKHWANLHWKEEPFYFVLEVTTRLPNGKTLWFEARPMKQENS